MKFLNLHKVVAIKVLTLLLTSLSCILLNSAVAQEILPRLEEPFAGKIGLTYKDSEAVKPELKIPATFGLENPSNILIVLIDDCGFGQMGTFGGGIPTPTLDRIANNGLKYTRFHTTALCSPTRAALLTGRNHHSVGSGVIGEAGTGFPGYSGIIPSSAATFAEIIREYGYANAWFGKNHSVPDWETSLVVRQHQKLGLV
jgi:arylsulfatase